MIDPRPAAEGGTLNYPALTIEALKDRPVRVKWINGLVDENGDYLPHLLRRRPDAALGEPARRPGRAPTRTAWSGVAVHGPRADGHARARSAHHRGQRRLSRGLVPAGRREHPGGLRRPRGTYYEQFKQEFQARWGVRRGSRARRSSSIPTTSAPTTLWYHDHTLGMTRAQRVRGPGRLLPAPRRPGRPGRPGCRGPAPQRGDTPGTHYHEIPIAIQDRSFNADGSLFYPDNRAFFEGLNRRQGPSSSPAPASCAPVHPRHGPRTARSATSRRIWNPEFFGNTMVVNGKTWPYLNVEQRRYRLRLLNGSEARFLILKHGRTACRSGRSAARAASCPARCSLTQLLIAPAERADVIVDFSGVPAGTNVVLENVGPDEPYGGGDARATRSSRPTPRRPAR